MLIYEMYAYYFSYQERLMNYFSSFSYWRKKFKNFWTLTAEFAKNIMATE